MKTSRAIWRTKKWEEINYAISLSKLSHLESTMLSKHHSQSFHLEFFHFTLYRLPYCNPRLHNSSRKSVSMVWNLKRNIIFPQNESFFGSEDSKHFRRQEKNEARKYSIYTYFLWSKTRTYTQLIAKECKNQSMFSETFLYAIFFSCILSVRPDMEEITEIK